MFAVLSSLRTRAKASRPGYSLLSVDKTNCEEVSTTGCRKLKAAGKASKCFIYHNMELALEWEESQRKVMYDPSKADYFLQYTDGQGNKNGTIYNEGIKYGDQFFWDYTNPEAADYFISSMVASLDDPAVDGTFTDDVGGVPVGIIQPTQPCKPLAQGCDPVLCVAPHSPSFDCYSAGGTP